jgi:hypothetical protein
MNTPSRIPAGRILAGVCAAALCGLALPTTVSAQTRDRYGYDQGYSYDPCQRERTQRGTGGALVGAGIGALAGSNVAGHGARTEGAVIGGLLGAIVGGNVGNRSAACQEGTYREAAPQARYDSRYGDQDGYAYQDDQDGYTYGDADDGYYAADPDDYGDQPYVRPATGGETADGCTLAESPIYLPDGTVQKRFVRVCRDANGRYQVVD